EQPRRTRLRHEPGGDVTRFPGGHVLVALTERVRSHYDDVNLVDAGRDSTIKATIVHHQARVADAVDPIDLCHHLLGIGQLWDGLGVHETRHLDPAYTCRDCTPDQFDLVVGRQVYGLILKPIARRYLQDLHPPLPSDRRSLPPRR